MPHGSARMTEQLATLFIEPVASAVFFYGNLLGFTLFMIAVAWLTRAPEDRRRPWLRYVESGSGL
jgi:hypothetical protein